LESKEVPDPINEAENKLNLFFESIEPDPVFARRLENQLIRVAAVSHPAKKALPIGQIDAILLEFDQERGNCIGRLGLLVIVLVYGINTWSLQCAIQMPAYPAIHPRLQPLLRFSSLLMYQSRQSLLIIHHHASTHSIVT